MNSNNLNIYTHRCKEADTKSSKCCFCRVCGIYMSRSNQRTLFYRSAKYNLIDPFRINDDVVLPELIRKQAYNRYFNAQANHLDHRPDLVSFLEDIAMKLDYSEATYYLAVAMVDALLSLYAVEKKQIKMICFMALTLAAKLHENNHKIPDQDAIVSLFDHQFDAEEVTNCESLLAKVLNYNLSIKTPYTFIEYFLSKGVVSSNDIGKLPKEHIESRMVQFERLVSLALQASTNHYEFYRFTSIAVATSVIACARRLMGFDYAWTLDLENLTGVAWESIEQCSGMLQQAIQHSCSPSDLGAFIEGKGAEFEFPPLICGSKKRDSVYTETTSEKDCDYEDRQSISEFCIDEENESDAAPDLDLFKRLEIGH